MSKFRVVTWPSFSGTSANRMWPRPKPMPPSIWARITSGLTATPQSTAHHTLWTRGVAVALQRDLGDLRDVACRSSRPPQRHGRGRSRPGPGPLGKVGHCAQRAGQTRSLAAHDLKPARNRVLAGGLQQLVDEALHRVARCGCGRPSATTASARPPSRSAARSGSRRPRKAVRARASTEVPSMPSLIRPSNGVPLRKDCPTMVLAQATILPSRTAPRMRCRNSGR